MEVDFPAGRRLKILPHRVTRNRRPPHVHEREYLEAILAHLRPGMVVYDVGAEEGEFTALVAREVGGANVHIIEPSAKYWPNIRAVWEGNVEGDPGSSLVAFASDETRGYPAVMTPWPLESIGPLLLEGEFGSLTEHPHIPAIRIDGLAEVRTPPAVIMIDVEGSEGQVLAGAERVLHDHRPTVFLSLHPNSWLARYGWSHARLFAFVRDLGYGIRYISSDHETHLELRPL